MVSEFGLLVLKRTAFFGMFPLAMLGLWWLAGLFKEVIAFQKGKFLAVFIKPNKRSVAKYLDPKEHGTGQIQEGVLSKEKVVLPSKDEKDKYVYYGGKSGMMPIILYDYSSGTPIPWQDRVSKVEYDKDTVNKMMYVAEAEGAAKGFKKLQLILYASLAAAALSLFSLLIQASVLKGA